MLNSANIFNNGGNVGIGTSSPGFKLHVPSGYIGTDYINTSDNSVGSGVSGVMVKAGDNYHRTATAAALVTFLNTTGAWIPNNGVGDWQIASSSTSTAYGAGSLELRESNFTGNGSATPPHLGFHWGGVVASNIALESSGRIAIRDNPGTGYENLIARETYTTNWFRNTQSGVGLYNESTGSGIYSPSANLMTLYNGSSLQITSAATGAGNLRFDASNPYIVASSYYVCPGGAYFNGGTVYAEADMRLRGGLSNDGSNFGGDLQVNDNLRITGVIPCIQGTCPPNNAVRLTPNLHLNAGAGYAVILNWDNGTTGASQALRIGNGASTDVFQVGADGHTAIGQGAGLSALYQNYVYHTQLTGNGDAQYASYSFRTRDSQNDGSGYGWGATNAAGGAYNFWGDVYTFGFHGHTYGDFTRTGGILGTGGWLGAWGSLGYKGSNSIYYGVYGSTGYASGGGYLADNAKVGIGGGFIGEVVGSWSKSSLIGSMNEGELMAQYNVGNVYTEGHSADILTVGNKRVAAYASTSPDLQVTKAGTGTLSNGTATINFDEAFAGMLDREALPVVTVTPVGNSNGIHIVEISRNGFTIRENNGGTSSVPFTYIVIGKRLDAKEATLPTDVVDGQFTNNVKAVMHDENNKEQSARPMWWDGNHLRFDAVPAEKHSKTDVAGDARARAAAESSKVNAAIESSKAAIPNTGMSPDAPKAEQFEKSPKIVKEADLKFIDPKTADNRPVVKPAAEDQK